MFLFLKVAPKIERIQKVAPEPLPGSLGQEQVPIPGSVLGVQESKLMQHL